VVKSLRIHYPGDECLFKTGNAIGSQGDHRNQGNFGDPGSLTAGSEPPWNSCHKRIGIRWQVFLEEGPGLSDFQKSLTSFHACPIVPPPSQCGMAAKLRDFLTRTHFRRTGAMSEGTHLKTIDTKTRSRNRWTLVLAGSAAALLASGVFIQVFRAPEGAAAEDETAGKVTLSSHPKSESLGRVNGESISYDAVARECMARYGHEVLDNFINRMIIHQACREKGIEVTVGEVDAEVRKIADKFELDVDNWYRMLQADRNLSPTQYRNDIIWPMLALKKLAGTEVSITEADLKKAFIRDYGPRVKAKMIMCNNFRRAQEVWEEVNKAPQEFGRLARKHSVDPNSKSLDGDIPPIRRYAGNENLEKTAFKLQEGEISGIVDMSDPQQKRFVILKCEGRTEPIVTDMAQVQEQLKTQLEDEKVQEAVANVFKKLKDEARVDNYLSGVTTNGVQQTAGTKSGSNVQPATGTRAAKSAPAQSNKF
jgi:foldase protein PrsA